MIDPRAIVDPSARLGTNVAVGPWSIIGPEVELGDDCIIASHVILSGPSVLGRANQVHPFAVIGEATPALAYGGERTRLVVGDDNVFREGVTVHRGTGRDRGETRIGHGNLLMAYAHVAHDCVVGNGCIFANNASLAGHVHVGDGANFGGYAGVPQYRRIGAHAMVGGMSLVLKDVPAFVAVSGNPARAAGVNVEGMRRNDFDTETIRTLRAAYHLLYRQGLGVEAALARMETLDGARAALAELTRSVRASRYGIVRPRTGGGGADGADDLSSLDGAPADTRGRG